MQFSGDLGYLGQGAGYGALIGEVVGAVASSQKKKPAAKPSMGAPRPSGSTTVSPVIQTKISPQISPVFSQIQDSAGASTYGAPTMTSSGAQTAETGSALPPGFPPSMRKRAYSPYNEYGMPTGSPYAPTGPIVSRQGGYQDLIKWGIIGAIGLFAIKSFNKGKGQRTGGQTYTSKNYKRLN